MKNLSVSQQRQIPEFRDRFINNIMNNKSTYEINDLRKDIDWIYEKCGYKAPKFVLVAKSYVEEKAMIEAINRIFGGNNRSNIQSPNIDTNIMKQIVDQVKSVMKTQMRDELWEKLYTENQVSYETIQMVKQKLDDSYINGIVDTVRNTDSQRYSKEEDETVWAKIINNIVNQLKKTIRREVEPRWIDDVWNKLFTPIDRAVTENVLNLLRRNNFKSEWIEQGFGLPWNAGWLAFYKYFVEIGFLDGGEFDRYYNLVSKLWSIQFFQDWCIVTQMPQKINRDNEGRLNSIEGSAIEWRNGESVYYIRGIHFPPDMWEDVVNERARKILAITNQEQKQAALSVVSLKSLLQQFHYKQIDSFKKPEPKLSKELVKDYNKLDYSKPIKLFKIKGTDFGIREDVHIINYFCPSTGREYFDYVPENITRAREGMAWKFNITEEEYMNDLVVET